MHMDRKGYQKIVYEASTVLLDREWLAISYCVAYHMDINNSGISQQRS